MKPTLNLYMKWACTGIFVDDEDAWKWAIELEEPGNSERKVLILNKSRDEVMAPTEIIDGVLMTVSMSARDTTLHFQMPTGHRQIISLKPTQYSISDVEHGGEVYPQWPEELEEAGIPSHPEEDVSAQPSEQWSEERERLANEQDRRHEREATEFLQEDKNAQA